ncbi:MAG: DUF1512 domain-containing protein [Candidatus Methanomethylicus sp.]|nr:DUF1512 domain-containing protein [Candidatus Methanomethylicus sp.]
MAPVGQLFGGTDMNSILFNVVLYIVMFAVIILFNQRMQLITYQRNVERAVQRLQEMSEKSREEALNGLKPFAEGKVDTRASVNDFLEFFAIDPVSLDPFGVLGRLEHILDNRRERSKMFVTQIAPKADRVTRENMEDVLEAAAAINIIFKVVRHYLLLGKKTKSLMIFVQLDMQLPMIMQQAEAYYSAQKTFAAGKPIGDGLGPLVASKLMIGQLKIPIAEEVVYSEVDIANRKVYVLKAEGPGGVVGKPGEGVKELVEKLEGKVNRIFMIDAALKLEGEKIGEVVEGVGAAIGDPGPEKFKIEDVAVKYKIPIDAIICKMSLEDALTTIKKEVVEASDVIVEKIKKAIQERTKEGDVVVVAGIGNTMGVSQ